jgi:hypothetical protein
LASVEGNGHGEHIAIGKAVVLTDTMHMVSCRCYRLFAQNEGVSHSNGIIRVAHTGRSLPGS